MDDSKKVINFREAEVANILRTLTAEEIMVKMLDQDFSEKMKSILPQDMVEMIMVGTDISDAACGAIRDFIVKRHGEITDKNPPTDERRDDYCQMCIAVASEILGRALAMYVPKDREAILEDFQKAASMTAIQKRCELDAEYAAEDAEQDDE